MASSRLPQYGLQVMGTANSLNPGTLERHSPTPTPDLRFVCTEHKIVAWVPRVNAPNFLSFCIWANLNTHHPNRKWYGAQLEVIDLCDKNEWSPVVGANVRDFVLLARPPPRRCALFGKESGPRLCRCRTGRPALHPGLRCTAAVQWDMGHWLIFLCHMHKMLCSAYICICMHRCVSWRCGG